MKEKILCWTDGGGSNGIVGDSTSHPDYHVGDVIAYKNPYSSYENLITNVICKDSNGVDFPMGLGGNSLLNLCKKTEVILVVGYENVTNAILSDIDSSVRIKEVEVIEMTQSQIEEELGYRVKIVD